MVAPGAGPCKLAPAVRSGLVAEWHDTTEEYLSTILELKEEGVVPLRARLVERLGVSAPAVSETVNRLVEQGYAELLDDRSLRLTSEGRRIATSVVRRHRLAERLLLDVIGLEWEKVHKEAARWEHVISDDVETRLVALLGDPATCPHGNPIPGSSRTPPGGPTVPLAGAPEGRFTVRRISERLETDDGALRLLVELDLVPGRSATVAGRTSAGVEVETAGGTRVVPQRVAELVSVSVAAG